MSVWYWCCDRREPELFRHCSKAAALRTASCQHRQNRSREIRARCHQSICAGCFKFVPAAIAPEHTEPAHFDRMGTGDVMAAISHHETVRDIDRLHRDDMREQLGLVVQFAARHRTMDVVEIRS